MMLRISQIKVFLVFFLTFYFYFNTSGQIIIGPNYSFHNIGTKSEDIELSTTQFQTLGLSTEFVSKKYFGIATGIDLNFGIQSEVSFFEIFFKGGVILNSTSRLQIPLFFGLGYASLNDKETPKYGDAIFGLEGHLRFYITDTFALNGGLKYAGISVDKIDDQEFNKTIGSIRVVRFSLGLSKQF